MMNIPGSMRECVTFASKLLHPALITLLAQTAVFSDLDIDLRSLQERRRRVEVEVLSSDRARFFAGEPGPRREGSAEAGADPSERDSRRNGSQQSAPTTSSPKHHCIVAGVMLSARVGGRDMERRRPRGCRHTACGCRVSEEGCGCCAQRQWM